MLLFNSEAWVLSNEQTRRLEQTWKLACRMAIRNHQKGITDIMEQLKVKPISQYIDQRKINWLHKIFQMDDTRLPRILLMTEALSSRNNLTDQVSTPAPNGPPSGLKSARSGADHAPPQDNNRLKIFQLLPPHVKTLNIYYSD